MAPVPDRLQTRTLQEGICHQFRGRAKREAAHCSWQRRRQGSLSDISSSTYLAVRADGQGRSYIRNRTGRRTMNLMRPLIGVTFLLVCQVAADCQAPPQFDAAVIKLDDRGGFGLMKGGPGTSDPGRVTWERVWLQLMLAAAFEVDADKISGPSWMYRNGAQGYDFTATMPPDTTKHDFHLMLQKFLVEQFAIQLRHEAKLFPAFELVAAPGGARLKTSAFADAPEPADHRLFATDVGADGFLVFPPVTSKLRRLKTVRLDTSVRNALSLRLRITWQVCSAWARTGRTMCWTKPGWTGSTISLWRTMRTARQLSLDPMLRPPVVDRLKVHPMARRISSRRWKNSLA